MEMFLTSETLKELLLHDEEVTVSWGGRTRKIIKVYGTCNLKVESIPLVKEKPNDQE